MGTHWLSCKSPRGMSASRQRSKRFGRWNSPAVMSIPQASVSKPAARQEIQKGELTRCHVNPPGDRQQAGSAAGGLDVGTHMLSCQPPRRVSASGGASRDPGRGTHSLSCQTPGDRQRAGSAQGIRKEKLTRCHVNPVSASRRVARDSEGNSLAVMSIPQASVSKPAARQGVWGWELTCCHINPPDERQQASSAASSLEMETHSLSC